LLDEKDESIVGLKKQLNIHKNNHEEAISNYQIKYNNLKSENTELKFS